MGRRCTRSTVLVIVISVCAVPYAASGSEPAGDKPTGEFVRLMNLGKAYLENRNSKEAIKVLDKAVALQPTATSALRNRGRANLLAGKNELAIEDLARAAQIDRDSAASFYLAGIARKHLSQFDLAVDQFEKAVRLDPHTAALRYQLANAYQAIARHDKAVEQLHETIRLDGLHAAAHFKLSGYARKERKRADFQRHTREFLRLRDLFGDAARSPVVLEQCVHTQPEAGGTVTDAATGIPAIDVRFVDATTGAFPKESGGITAACVLDVDESGRPTIFVAGTDATLQLLRLAGDGTVERTKLDIDRLEGSGFKRCIVGDFYNDVPQGAKYDAKLHALNDVLLVSASGIRLLKRTGAARFKDVTKAAGLDGLTARRALWVDYDHDGDIDLFLAKESGAALWQNNGDGRFEDVTARVGIKSAGSALDATAVELDANVAVDLIVAYDSAPTRVFINQRAGRFAPLPEPPGPWPAAVRVLADDLNNDGHADALLVGSGEGVILLGETAGRARVDLSGVTPVAAGLIDYDNDGWLDLLVAGANPSRSDDGVIRLWRNVSRSSEGASQWSSVDEQVGVAGINVPSVRDVVPVDFDADGDTDLLLLTNDRRLRWLRNDGGNANAQLKVRLSTIKTNPTGIGTHIEVRSGGFWLTRGVRTPSIEIGVGPRRQLDAIQTLWTNGVVDNQIDTAVSHTPLTVVEKNVATGSCPFCYAWDGRGFRFVTDVLGNSPIGLSLKRDVMLSADPDEIVMIGPGEQFPPTDGAYAVQITEEYCETLYLDTARLIAVDHPPAVEAHPTDKIMFEPFPTSQVRGVTSVRAPMKAVGDDGIDRTRPLQTIDGDFAPPGPLLPPPFRGMCHPMSLTLDFGEIDVTRPLSLVLTGWLRYGQASTNIALSQSSAHAVMMPALEAETSHGWQAVDVVVGMPAGKTKTILCDLTGKLPAATRRLRLTTTFEIRWDRIALAERVSLPDEAIHAVAPSGADLVWRGFSKLAVRAPGHPKTPEYDVVAQRPPWRTVQEGWCTRYGDALELILEADSRLAILNAGDAITLRFSEDAFPPVQPNHIRTFFLYTLGWEKDGDHNVVSGDRVGPLPAQGAAERSLAPTDEDDWRLRYNTRWVPRDRFQR